MYADISGLRKNDGLHGLGRVLRQQHSFPQPFASMGVHLRLKRIAMMERIIPKMRRACKR
jgi:hypothetical protein